MRTLLLPILTAALLLPGQTLRIGGGAAPMENILKPIQAPFERQSGLRLELSADGPDAAFIALEAGKLDAAAAGLSFQAWLELMKAKTYLVKDPKAFAASVIGFDRIHVLVHPDIAVMQLSKSQVKAIFTGKVTNWKALGGPELPIRLVVGTKVPGTNKIFLETALDGEPMRAADLTVGATPEILEAISKTPGAVGFGPHATTGDWKVWAPQLDIEIGRPITLITRGPHSKEIRQLVEFIHQHGKEHIIH